MFFDAILVELYVEDLVIKSRKRNNHVEDLRQVFNQLRWYQFKMNPLKYAFKVISPKFLGFVMCHQDIEIGQVKINVILKMPEPRNIHELKGLQERLA